MKITRYSQLVVLNPDHTETILAYAKLTALPAAIMAIAAGLLPVGRGGGASSSPAFPPLGPIIIGGGGGGGGGAPNELDSLLGGGNLLAGEAPGRGGGGGASSSSDSWSYLDVAGTGRAGGGGCLTLPFREGSAGGGGMGRFAVDTPGGGGGGGILCLCIAAFYQSAFIILARPFPRLVYNELTELAPDLEGKGGAFLAEPGRGGGALRDDTWSNQHPTLPITVPHSTRA